MLKKTYLFIERSKLALTVKVLNRSASYTGYRYNVRLAKSHQILSPIRFCHTMKGECTERQPLDKNVYH